MYQDFTKKGANKSFNSKGVQNMMTRLKIACLLYVKFQIFQAFSGQD